MNYLTLLILSGLSLALLPVNAQFDGDKSEYEQELERLESEHKKWDARAREAVVPEEKEQLQALATQYSRLYSLRKEVESAFGSKKIPLQQRLEKLRADTQKMQMEVNTKFPPPNPFPDNPFDKSEAEAEAAVEIKPPPSSYKTKSGFEIKLRLVD